MSNNWMFDAIEKLDTEDNGYEKGYKAAIEQIFNEIESPLVEWIKLYYNISVSTFDSIEAAKAVASESVLRAFNDYLIELKKKYGVG